METPIYAQLNTRNLQWLQDEAAKWFTIYGNASGQDKIDAKAYLDQVLAEQAQRAKQMLDPIEKWTWPLSAPFEAVGGSAGAGASGLSTSIAVGAKEGAKAAVSGAQSILIAVTVVALVVGGIWAYGGRKRGSN